MKTQTYPEWLIEQFKKLHISLDTLPRSSPKEKLRALEKEENLVGYNLTKSVRMDGEMAHQINLIALFERAKPGTLLKLWVYEKIRTYYRNPDFKHWEKRVE